MRNRTWPVFLIGISSLLALLFVPGLVALRKTQEVYDEIRVIQESHQRSQRSLNEIERRMYLMSVVVRDALLDTSPESGTRYERDTQECRKSIEVSLAELQRDAIANDNGAMRRLETELAAYWNSVAPVFHWTPEERQQRATYFLREQQRPRRAPLLAIAEEIGTLTTSAFREQYDRVNQSQREFREDIERIIVAAFLVGVFIAIATVLRMSILESRTERQRSKTERAEEELRSLSTQLMHAQEEERKTLSRELHDEVGQMLTGLRMELGTLERLRDDPEQFHAHAADAKLLAEQTLRAVRDLAVGLRPSVLDLGLIPALQWQARHFSRHSGVRVAVHSEGSFDRIPEEHKTCVYRVVQETLTNCAKHSMAKSVDVAVQGVNGDLDVSIRDDGKGFNPAQGRNEGIGLIGMEERVRELGGTLTIDSRPGKGTLLALRLKLPQETVA